MKLNRKIGIVILLVFAISLALTGCNNQQAEDPAGNQDLSAANTIEAKGYAHPEMLTSVDELQEIIANGEENVRILDVRSPAKYILGHIPGAVNIWRPDYEAPEDKYGFGGMLCEQAQWEELMGKLGISNDTRVILYDDKGLYDSARVWWALYGFGHRNMQVLDGGLNYWKAKDGETTIKQPEVTATTYEAKDFEMDIYATLDEVKPAAGGNDTVIVDTRATDEYTGEKLKKGAFRKGRIPDVVWIEGDQGLNEDETVKSAEDLKALFREKGDITVDTPVIAYCQSGVRSASTWFTLRLIGYDHSQNYDGSWIEWSYNDGLNIEAGE